MAMGYGGVAGRGTVTGKSGDSGIDGVIKQDKFGLDVVCFQAKRWDGPVGRPVIQGFVGSKDYIRARKGVILTTSTFTKDAVDYVERIEGKKIVLINGDQLADLMIDHGLGVTTAGAFEIREVSMTSSMRARDEFERIHSSAQNEQSSDEMVLAGTRSTGLE